MADYFLMHYLGLMIILAQKKENNYEKRIPGTTDYWSRGNNIQF